MPIRRRKRTNGQMCIRDRTETVLAGARRFNRGVQGKEVGLFGEIIDNFHDLADVIRAAAKSSDNSRRSLDGRVGAIEPVSGFFHRRDTGVNFFARTVGDVEKHLGGVRDALN